MLAERRRMAAQGRCRRYAGPGLSRPARRCGVIRPEPPMQYVCDASPTDTWFQIETEGEAALESRLMNHAVEKYFRQAQEQAIRSYVPPPGRFIEQNIGLKTHVQRVMPRFLTLRDAEGNGLATAMLPP